MFGLFLELGPFYFDAASRATEDYNKTGVPTMWRNPYAWTNVANVLIINSPPPVGYSYCDPDGPTGKGYSCGNWNDSRTSYHNQQYLENWARAFPEYAQVGKTEWYLVGESYAGVYVPTLVRRILQDDTSNVRPLLRGMAIGDGCVGTEVLCGPSNGPFHYLKFMNGHGQFADKLWNGIMAACPMQNLTDGSSPPTGECKALIGKVGAQLGGYFAYNLYDTCWYQNSFNPHPHSLEAALGARRAWGPPPKDAVERAEREHAKKNNAHVRVTGLGGAENDYPCGGPGALFEWVQTAPVKAALHVAPDAYFFSGDDGVGFNYTVSEPNLLPFYAYLNENAEKLNFRTLVYNGDTDPAINSFAAQNWTVALGFDEKQSWRPWTLDGKQYMGGYVTRYEGSFDFLTIRGSGHMVPEYKPKPALEFLSKWLANEDWLPYVKA